MFCSKFTLKVEGLFLSKFLLVGFLFITFQSYSQQGNPLYTVEDVPNYIQPITTRDLDKDKPSVTLAGEVNIANGTAAYSLPINLPPGVQGLQPNLAITYNSNGGNGQLGLGWALAGGTSAISRGGNSFFLDGGVSPVTLTVDDKLYLDGQRLVKHGSAVNFAETDQYRTLTESYQKIEFVDNDIIEVTQKDGIKRFYGSPSARLQLVDPVTQTAITQSWLLFRVEDRNGNYMTYEYFIDAATNEVRLENINYTGNALANASAKTQVQFRYMKRTDARSGFMLGNEVHNSILLKSITVVHKNDMGMPEQYSKYTLNYMFDQTPKLGNDFSKLVEIQYQAQTMELNSVVVMWPIQSAEFEFNGNLNLNLMADYDLTNYPTWNQDQLSGQKISGDFNGDGKSDFLVLRHKVASQGQCWVNGKNETMTEHKFDVIGFYRSNSPSLSFNQSFIINNQISQVKPSGCLRYGYAQIYPGDFNGDGLLDFVLQRVVTNSAPPFNSYYADIWLNNPASPGNFSFHSTVYTTNEVWCTGNTSSYNCYNYQSTENPYRLLVQDFDGNGITDIGYAGMYDISPSPGMTGIIQAGLKVHFFEADLTNTTGDYPISSLAALDSVYPGDFNGDGVVDWLMTNGNVSSKIVTLANKVYKEIWTGGFPNGYHFIAPGDFNGDGLTDVLVYNQLNHWLLSYFDGIEFSLAVDLTSTFNQNLNLNLVNGRPSGLSGLPWFSLLDADADGRMDVVFISTNPSKIIYNKLSGWEVSIIPPSIILSSTSGHTKRYQNSLFVVDFEGDGSSNLIYNVHFGNVPFYLNFRPLDQSHRISSILDGANTLSTFTFNPLTNTAVYARGNTESYPNPVITAPLYVVSKFEQKLFDATSIANVTYQYEGARVNTVGLGLLGFEKVITTDIIQGRRSTSTFALPTTQLPLYKTQPLLPQKTEVYSTVTNAPLASTEYTYYGTVVQTNQQIFPWQYNPQVQEEKSKDFVHGTSAKAAYVYDGNGNLSSQTKHSYNNTNFAAPYVSKTEEVATYTSVGNGSWPLWLPNTTTTTVTRYGQTAAVQQNVFTYYANGNLHTATVHPGTEAEIASSYLYNGFGNVTQKTVTPQNLDPRITSYVYTTDQRFVKTETNPLTWSVNYEYNDLLGVRTKQTDFNNLETNWEYDEFARQTKEIAPDGTEVITTYAYFTGTNPNLLFWNTVTGTAMPEAQEFLDGLGRTRLKQVLNRKNEWIAVRSDFDSRGRQYRSSQPYIIPINGTTPTVYWNTTTFDDNNRPQTVSTAAGNSTTIVYNGRTTTTTNTNTNQSKSSTVDADGLTLTATDDGGTITYVYNSFGKPISITGPSGTPIKSTYDDYGRQTELDDPAAGPMHYEYDALGQLLQQTDNAGNTYNMTYDLLGRTTEKTGPEGTYTYTYDVGFLGKPETQTAPNGISTTTHYDGLGRPETHTEEIDGATYAFGYTYTTEGQLQTKTYPNGFEVNYSYNSNGYLTEMTRASDNRIIWQFGDENRFGQLTQYSLGDNTTWNATFEDISGLPMSIDNNKNWGMTYSFDVHTGNIDSRSHNYNGQSESFAYDPLDRLLTYGPASAPQTVTYANTGSITFKSDAGTYTNHALTGRTEHVDEAPITPSSNFEISEVAQNLTYTAFNSVETISEDAFDAFFTYGPDQQRKHMVINENGSSYIERYYIGGSQYERDRLPNGDWRNLTYINTPAGLSAVFIQNENTQQEDFYFVHTDYQGSIMAIADYEGDILEEYSYDPWGNRRDPNTWQNIYTNTTLPSFGSDDVGLGILYRGYTAHEHLDCFALINMNGRMYDPVLGRMLSADNFTHIGTQGLNRYSYCVNNPLKYTDPSGEFAIVDSWLVGFFDGFFSTGNSRWSAGWNEANLRAGNDAKIWGGLFASDPNKSFGGRVWETLSRFTWQLPQTLGGFLTAQSVNTLGLFGGVSQVDYAYGATTVTTRSENWGAVTQGSFIVGNNTLLADANNPLFQHEYGHYLQSQSMGWAYYPRVGVPSARSSGVHDFHPVEQDANRRAFLYFNEKVEGFYVSEDDFDSGVNRGWDFWRNPLNVDGSNTRDQYVDYRNPDHLNSLDKFTVSARWYDHVSWLLLPVGGPIWMGLINAGLYNR